MQKILLAMVSILFSSIQVFGGQWLFIGTYTSTGSKGIYVYKFDESTGKLDSVSSVFIENPSYLALSGDGNYLYAVTENGGDKPGEVSAFSFDKETGKLSFLNKQLTKGDHPCYVSVDEENNWLAVANYTGGNLSMFPIRKDGSLEPAAQTIQHYGKSIIESRQAAPHMHMAVFSPKEQYLVANDLGTDEVNGYKFKSSKNGIPLDTPASIRLKMKAGSGPRHLAFHPNKPLVYVLEELSGTISVHYFTKNNVSLIQEIAADTTSPLPDKGSADIHFSPDGKFLYASNRGKANYLAIYSVNSEGKLWRVGTQPVLGKAPRNFTLDETGNYLLVANMGTDNIVVFKRDASTGLLTATGEQLAIPTPVCVKMMKMSK
jgi:6-phosphogluconolactonase